MAANQTTCFENYGHTRQFVLHVKITYFFIPKPSNKHALYNVSTFSRNCESGHDVNKTDRDTSDKMAHGAEDLHSRPLASPVANDVITGIAEHSDFPRIKKLALVFAGNAKGKLELAFFVKNLK